MIVNGNHQIMYCSHSNTTHTHTPLSPLPHQCHLSPRCGPGWQMMDKSSPPLSTSLWQRYHHGRLDSSSAVLVWISKNRKTHPIWEWQRYSWLAVATTVTTVCSLHFSIRNYHFLLICNTDVSLCVILSASHELSLDILSSLEALLYGWQWEVFRVLNLVTWKLNPFT